MNSTHEDEALILMLNEVLCSVGLEMGSSVQTKMPYFRRSSSRAVSRPLGGEAAEAAVSHGDDDELIRRLNEAVPTYTPMSSRSIEHIH